MQAHRSPRPAKAPFPFICFVLLSYTFSVSATQEELECTAHLPLQDDTTRMAADILERAISADTKDGGSDIHDVDAARQVECSSS